MLLFGKREMRRVGDVRDLDAEHGAESFQERDTLGQAGMGDANRVAFQGVHSAGAVAAGVGGRHGESRWVEPLVHSPRARVRVADTIGQLRHVTQAGVGRVRPGEERRVILPRSDRADGLQAPAADYAVRDGSAVGQESLPLSEGQVPQCAGDEVQAPVAGIAGPVIGHVVRIGGIGVVADVIRPGEAGV